MYHLLPVRARSLSASLSGMKVMLTADVGLSRWSGGVLSDLELRLAVVSLRGTPFPHLTSSPSTLGNTLKTHYLVLSLGTGDSGGGRGFVGINHVQERKPSCQKSNLRSFLGTYVRGKHTRKSDGFH